MQAYCVKCRAKREMKDARAITMKNGKPACVNIDLCDTASIDLHIEPLLLLHRLVAVVTKAVQVAAHVPIEVVSITLIEDSVKASKDATLDALIEEVVIYHAHFTP